MFSVFYFLFYFIYFCSFIVLTEEILVFSYAGNFALRLINVELSEFTFVNIKGIKDGKKSI